MKLWSWSFLINRNYVSFLIEGTLRPDLIESASHLASGNATTIKTHHNDSQLVRDLREKVCFHMFNVSLLSGKKFLSGWF